jgi:hypothetical protein
VEFIRAAETEYNDPKTDDRLIRAAEAELELVTSSREVWIAAEHLTEAADNDDGPNYDTARRQLLTLAHQEIEGIE